MLRPFVHAYACMCLGVRMAVKCGCLGQYGSCAQLMPSLLLYPPTIRQTNWPYWSESMSDIPTNDSMISYSRIYMAILAPILNLGG